MTVADLPVHPTQMPRNTVVRGLRLREDTLFTDSQGNEKPKIRQNTEIVVERLGEFLQRLLEPDETIFTLRALR